MDYGAGQFISGDLARGFCNRSGPIVTVEKLRFDVGIDVAKIARDVDVYMVGYPSIFRIPGFRAIGNPALVAYYSRNV